jgi:hypothetical protein
MRIAFLMAIAVGLSAPAGAQTTGVHVTDVFVGWAPLVGENAAVHEFRGWTMSLGGGTSGSLTAVLDLSGWYFGFGQSIHSFLGGARYRLPHAHRAAPFVQIVSGPTIWHARGTAFGLGLVPGGGIDAMSPDRRFGVRVEGDYFGTYSPGDYGRHYWGHMWRLSTGVIFTPNR